MKKLVLQKLERRKLLHRPHFDNMLFEGGRPSFIVRLLHMSHCCRDRKGFGHTYGEKGKKPIPSTLHQCAGTVGLLLLSLRV